VVEPAAARVVDPGDGGELVEGLGLERELVRQQDLERGRVGARREPHGEDTVGVVDVEARA
jgi:hypothetical protein